MLNDFVNGTPAIHHEYLRRQSRSPEPLEQPRHGLRRVIGETLISIGQRLARVERRPADEAA